jgi:hypothetical protein
VPKLGNRDDPRADVANDGEEVAEVVMMAVRDQRKVERADVTQPRRAQRIAIRPRPSGLASRNVACPRKVT